MNKLLTAGAALLALGLSVSAKAADMPVKYVAPAPVFTWTGCYVGAHVGYAWGTSKQEYGGTRAGVPDAFLPVGFDLTGNYNTNGVVGGGQGGCNYQTGAWVWGVEVDGAWASVSGQANPTAGAIAAGANAQRLFTTNQRWLSTARGRLGWAADRWMWYVTGGAAWTGIDVNNDALAVAANAAPGSDPYQPQWLGGRRRHRVRTARRLVGQERVPLHQLRHLRLHRLAGRERLRPVL